EADLDPGRITNWGEEWPTWRVLWTMIDHDLHHGGEIGALRDLYRERTMTTDLVPAGTPTLERGRNGPRSRCRSWASQSPRERSSAGWSRKATRSSSTTRS